MLSAPIAMPFCVESTAPIPVNQETTLQHSHHIKDPDLIWGIFLKLNCVAMGCMGPSMIISNNEGTQIQIPRTV